MKRLLFLLLIACNFTSEASNQSNSSPSSSSRNKVGLSRKFIKHIVERNIVDTKYTSGNTALHLAVQERMPNIVKLLLEVNANKNRKNNKKQTPLEMAKFIEKENYPFDESKEKIKSIIVMLEGSNSSSSSSSSSSFSSSSSSASTSTVLEQVDQMSQNALCKHKPKSDGPCSNCVVS